VDAADAGRAIPARAAKTARTAGAAGAAGAARREHRQLPYELADRYLRGLRRTTGPPPSAVLAVCAIAAVRARGDAGASGRDDPRAEQRRPRHRRRSVGATAARGAVRAVATVQRPFSPVDGERRGKDRQVV